MWTFVGGEKVLQEKVRYCVLVLPGYKTDYHLGEIATPEKYGTEVWVGWSYLINETTQCGIYGNNHPTLNQVNRGGVNIGSRTGHIFCLSYQICSA